MSRMRTSGPSRRSAPSSPRFTKESAIGPNGYLQAAWPCRRSGRSSRQVAAGRADHDPGQVRRAEIVVVRHASNSARRLRAARISLATSGEAGGKGNKMKRSTIVRALLAGSAIFMSTRRLGAGARGRSRTTSDATADAAIAEAQDSTTPRPRSSCSRPRSKRCRNRSPRSRPPRPRSRRRGRARRSLRTRKPAGLQGPRPHPV